MDLHMLRGTLQGLTVAALSSSEGDAYEPLREAVLKACVVLLNCRLLWR